MKTMEIYAENSYIKECEAQIVSLNGNLVVFDRTIDKEFTGAASQRSILTMKI